jgi:hypothetical protein
MGYILYYILTLKYESFCGRDHGYQKVFQLIQAFILWSIDMKLILLLLMAMLACPLSAVADQIADHDESAEENIIESAEISEKAISYKIHDCDEFSLEYPANWIGMDLTEAANYIFESMDQPIEGMVGKAYVFMEMPSFKMLFGSEEDFQNMTIRGFTFSIDNATPQTYSISFEDTMLTPEGAPDEIIMHAVETLRIKNRSESIP